MQHRVFGFGRFTACLLLFVALGFTPSLLHAEESPGALDEIRASIVDEIDGLLGQIDDATDAALPQTQVIRRKLAELLALSTERHAYNDGENAEKQAARSPESIQDGYAACAGRSGRDLVTELQKLVDGHFSVGYTQARKYMFCQIDNEDGEVECVYTGRHLAVGNQIPSSNDMNCEHTWPQSHGATGVAKSDMHHLFCTDSKANGVRSSLSFGEVSKPKWSEGGSSMGNGVFEVRPQNRGNTARALMYFALRYRKKIKDSEERVVRKWHREDPPDAAERARNDAIFAIQRNRNPFVDHPEYVEQIQDF